MAAIQLINIQILADLALDAIARSFFRVLTLIQNTNAVDAAFLVGTLHSKVIIARTILGITTPLRTAIKFVRQGINTSIVARNETIAALTLPVNTGFIRITCLALVIVTLRIVRIAPFGSAMC
jgi:hypothetical protein